MAESNKISESRKEKRRAARKLYRDNHKEEIRIYKKLYYASHEEEIQAYHKIYRASHKEDIQITKKLYRDNHKEEIRISKKFYYASHKEEAQAYNKIYHASHKGEARDRNRKRRKNDPIFRLKSSISNTIRRGFKTAGLSKNKKSQEILECSFEDFVAHIENQFKEGMTLENHGKWQLDHIVPISLAETIEDVIALNHHSNFQPLWKEDNCEKSDELALDIISPENKIRYKTIIDRYGNKSI